MVYGLCMLGGVFVVVLYSACIVQNFDMPVVLAGMLGIYLLFCTYASIGLFMSSLTSYQVVAAIGTIAIFAMLGYVGNSWQHVEFVRDLTCLLYTSAASVLGQNYDNKEVNARYWDLASYTYGTSSANKITDPIWKRAFNVIANCNNLIQQVETKDTTFFPYGKVERDLVLSLIHI